MASELELTSEQLKSTTGQQNTLLLESEISDMQKNQSEEIVETFVGNGCGHEDSHQYILHYPLRRSISFCGAGYFDLDIPIKTDHTQRYLMPQNIQSCLRNNENLRSKSMSDSCIFSKSPYRHCENKKIKKCVAGENFWDESHSKKLTMNSYATRTVQVKNNSDSGNVSGNTLSSASDCDAGECCSQTNISLYYSCSEECNKKGATATEVNVENNRQSFSRAAVRHIPFDSLDHEMQFKQMLNEDGLNFDSHKENSGNLNCTLEAETTKPALSKFVTNTNDVAQDRESAIQKDEFVTGFPLHLIATSNHEKRQNGLQFPRMISKAIFDKLVHEFIKVKTENTALKKYFELLQNQFQAAQMQHTDYEQCEQSYFIPSDNSQTERLRKQQEAAQMQLVEDLPNRDYQNELQNREQIAEIQYNEQPEGRHSHPPHNIYENELQNKVKELEQRIQELEKVADKEKRRADNVTKVLEDERMKFNRDMKCLKVKLEMKKKMKGDGLNPNDKGLHKSKHSGNSPSRHTSDKSLHDQGAIPKSFFLS